MTHCTVDLGLSMVIQGVNSHISTEKSTPPPFAYGFKVFGSFQLGLQGTPNPMKRGCQWSRGCGGSISHPLACFGGHLGVVCWKFWNQMGFSEAYFLVFPAFTKSQNPFPFQMSVNWNGKGFRCFVP